MQLLGDKLMQLRKKKGVTAAEVSTAINMSQGTYEAYEIGKRYPAKLRDYQKLADFFQVELDSLCGKEEKFVIEAAEKYGSRGRKQAEQLVIDTIRGFENNDR